MSAAAVSTAPWWGLPVLTLLSAVAGGLITQGFGMLNDWRGARRDDKRADRDTRREALVAFLTAGNSAAQNFADDSRAHSFTFSNQFTIVLMMFSGELRDRLSDYFSAVVRLLAYGESEERHNDKDRAKFTGLADAVVSIERDIIELAQKNHVALGLPPAVGDSVRVPQTATPPETPAGEVQGAK